MPLSSAKNGYCHPHGTCRSQIRDGAVTAPLTVQPLPSEHSCVDPKKPPSGMVLSSAPANQSIGWLSDAPESHLA